MLTGWQLYIVFYIDSDKGVQKLYFKGKRFKNALIGMFTDYLKNSGAISSHTLSKWIPDETETLQPDIFYGECP